MPYGCSFATLTGSRLVAIIGFESISKDWVSNTSRLGKTNKVYMDGDSELKVA